MSSCAFLGSATAGRFPGAITSAFRFLEPITAPIPMRDAWKERLVTIDANLTRFSPAVPITAVLIPAP